MSAVLIAGSFYPLGLDAFLDEMIAGTIQPGNTDSQLVDGVLYALWGPVLTALLLIVVAIRGSGLRRTFAIGGTVFGRPLVIAIAAGVALGAVEYVVGLFFPTVRELFDLPMEGAALALAVFGIVVGAPIGEELLFRGFVYTPLRERWGFVAALTVTSVLFAAAHLESTGWYFALVLPSGFLLGWLREKTGGVAAPIFLHALFNLSSVLFVLLRPA